MTDPDIVTRLRESDGGFFMRKMFTESADEIERLRAERDEARRAICESLQSLIHLRQEQNALRDERDDIRRSYCSLMEAYRGGDGRVTANKLGWGYLFEEDKP